MSSDRRVLLVNSLYHLTNDAAVIVMAGQITVLQDQLRFGYLGAGILTAVALVVTVVFQIVFGHFSDRRDPARFLTWAILFLGAATMAISLANGFATLVLLVAIARIGSSAYHPVGIGWVGRSFTGPDLDHAMGFQSSFGDVGVILGLATGAVLGSALGWQAPFLVWGALNLAAAALAVWLLKGGGGVAAPRPVARVRYGSILRDVRYWLLPIAIVGAAFNVIVTFGPTLVKHKFGQTDAIAGVSMALWILAGSAAAFYFGRLSRRFGRYRSLLGAYAFLALAALVAATMGLPLALGALWTLGSALFITYPATFSFVSEASHDRVQGAAFGVIFGFQLLGGAAAVYAAGFLAERLGNDPSIPFFLVSALSAVGFVYLLVVRGRIARAVRAGSAAAPQL